MKINCHLLVLIAHSSHNSKQTFLIFVPGRSDVPSGPPQQLPVMESSIRMEAGKQRCNYINLKQTITFSVETV